MKKLFFIIFILATINASFAQQAYYNVTPRDGYGLRFWNSDHYKIHMGNAAENHYGPVTDYSIKMNMSNTVGRGWTWGVMGATPIAALNISGNMQIAGKFESRSIKINGANPISSVGGFLNKIELTGGNHAAIVFKPGETKELMFGFHDNGNFYWGTGNSATVPNYYSMFLNGSNGNLGIKGKLTSSEVEIKIGGWADYVFEEKYNLPTLLEVENHIKEKGHLINIPSAKEVTENGIQLGEINMKLLEKIEELTLYTIAQEKEIKNLQSELQQQKFGNQNLESRLSKLEEFLLNNKTTNKN